MLAGTIVNFGVEAVLGAVTDPLAGKAEVEADHGCQTAREVEGEEAHGLGPFDKEAVHGAHQEEEGAEVDEKPGFELHTHMSFWFGARQKGCMVVVSLHSCSGMPDATSQGRRLGTRARALLAATVRG